MDKTEDGFSGHLWISSGDMRMPSCSRGQQFVHVFVCLYDHFGGVAKRVLGEKTMGVKVPPPLPMSISAACFSMQ